MVWAICALIVFAIGTLAEGEEFRAARSVHLVYPAPPGSFWNYNWQLGETNRFLIGAAIQGQKTAYTAWLFTKESWKKLATFATRTKGRPLKGYYSFIEDFRRDGKSVQETRRARFGPGWVQTTNSEWGALTKAKFTASGASWESKENINAGADARAFFIATGGPIARTRELGSWIDLPTNALTPPRTLLDLIAKAGDK
jgi:hypothetical protein